MEKFYSNIEQGLLLHMVVRQSDIIDGRQNLVDDDQYLQCASLNLKKGTTFTAHKHIFKTTDFSFPQESWVVIKGSVKCIFYDINDKIIAEPILNEGDASFSFWGGHNYLILEDNSKILEYKVGPYLGQEKDKKFLNKNE